MNQRMDADDLEPVIIMAKPVDPVERKGGMRLNAQMKDEVVKKAMEHGFAKRHKELLKEEQALTKAFWLKNFGPAKLKHARALGEPFVMESKDHYGKAVPDGFRMQWCVGGQYLTMYTQMPVPTGHIGNGNKHFRVTDQTLIDRCRAWQAATDKLREEESKAQGTLMGMLLRITTYPSLEKNWPQGVKFYSHLPKAYPFRHQVPAVQIDELNAALGIG
jgi:hypothetical protein